MSEHQRLDDTAGATVHCQDGKVGMVLWFDGRKPNDDPVRVDMTPGEAMDLAANLIKSAKTAMLRHLGAHR